MTSLYFCTVITFVVLLWFVLSQAVYIMRRRSGHKKSLKKK